VVNPANAIFCSFGRLTGQPVVLNTDGQEWIRGKWGRLGKAFFYWSARFSGKATTGLISDSRAMARLYREEFRATSSVIPYCWTALEPATDAAPFEELDTTTGEYCCIAGRLVPENNAVPVARAYRASRLPWPLLVLGAANYDSPVQRELEALAATDDRIRLVGHVGDRAKYAALVRGARIYIHAHSVGGINPSLLEAMGLSARVLALATSFNREALGETGQYFEAFGPALTSTLERCTEDPDDLVARLRTDARARVREMFLLDDVADAVEELLMESVRRGSRAHVTIPTMWATDDEHFVDLTERDDVDLVDEVLLEEREHFLQ
jgi:glycosyltransferase involved in cell wall biosynthesis